MTAAVGDDAVITADGFKLNAEKKAVTDDDFKQLIDMRYLITDSSALNDEQRAEANTGLIDVHKGEDEDSYTVDVNLSTEKLLDAADALNFLSSQNTYAEAIAGSVATGKTKANLAGSFSVAVTENTVRATLGHNVTIKANNGNADVTAADGATTRVIAGSLSAAPAKASVGATVAVLVNGDSAETVTGDNAQITASGDITHSAQQTGDAQAFTAAMAVAAGANTTAAAGGAINVIVNKSAARNTIGNHASMNAGGDARIDSQAKYDLMLISGSANVTAGTGKVAAGGAVNVIVDKTQAATTLGDQNTITAGSNVSVTSDVSDQLISGSMSASVAATATGKSGAGAVNVIVSKSAADTALGSAVNITAEAGDLKLKANNDAWMLNATLAAALGTDMGIGGSFNVNVFDREADLSLADGNLAAGRDLYAQSGGNDTSILAGAALAGGITGGAFSGNVEVLTESSRREQPHPYQYFRGRRRHRGQECHPGSQLWRFHRGGRGLRGPVRGGQRRGRHQPDRGEGQRYPHPAGKEHRFRGWRQRGQDPVRRQRRRRLCRRECQGNPDPGRGGRCRGRRLHRQRRGGRAGEQQQRHR